MLQARFRVEERQARFLDEYRDYGFKDKSTMLRAAIDHFQDRVTREHLKQSAELYAEVYSEDEDLRELTEAALTGWPQ